MEESKETINYKIDNKPRTLKADEIECRVEDALTQIENNNPDRREDVK